MAFRANSKAFFLTFPQCFEEPATIGAHLESLHPTEYCVVARELHQDGNPHLHALVIYTEKKNIRNATFFDFNNYHPNIISPRDRKATVTYIKKGNPTDTDLYESGEVPTSVDKDSAWRAAVDATTAVEVHRIISKSHPKEYLIHHDKIEYFANKKARNLEDYNPNIDDVFVLPPAIEAYLQGDFVNTVSSPSASSGRSRDRSSL